MLTQRPVPDIKCKLNISSFLALPHFLDCLLYQEFCVHCVFVMNDGGVG